MQWVPLGKKQMNIQQTGFVFRSGLSALVVASLLGYLAHYEWGLSRGRFRLAHC